MRASELLDLEVHDDHGHRLGKVHDIRLVQDQAGGEGRDNLFRVDALLVGRTGFAIRMGFARNEVRGPWLIRVLATHWERRADEIPWAELELVDGRLIRRQNSQARV